MAVKNDIVDINLETGNIHRSFLNHSIGSGDITADRFGVRCFRNGVPETLTGACTGYFIRSDGGTVVIAGGTVSGNTAYVELPEACYAVEGQFALAIKVTQNGATSTLRIVDGMVSRTTTDAIVDPGTLVPSIEDLIEEIEEAVATIPPEYTDLKNAVEYAAGDNLEKLAYINGHYIDHNGAMDENENARCSDFIPVPKYASFMTVYVLYNNESVLSPVGYFYNEAFEPIRELTGEDHANGYKKFYIGTSAVYVRFNQSYGYAADSGKHLFRFEYNAITSTRTDSDMATGDHDLHDLEPNRIYNLYGQPEGTVSNLPYENWRGNVLTVFGTGNAQGIGKSVVALSSTNRIHVCRSWGSGGTYSDWVELLNGINAFEMLDTDFVGKVTFTFVENTRDYPTEISLEAGKSYKIVCDTIPDGRVRFFCKKKSSGTLESAYADLCPYKTEVDIVPETPSLLFIYNVDNTTNAPYTVRVYEQSSGHSLETQGRVYHVSKNPTARYHTYYTSLTQCLLDLKDDDRPKKIIIESGEYDIYQEYQDAGVPPYTGDDPVGGYFDYCVWIPKNTHIIGIGIVRLIWMPEKTQVTHASAYAVSPVNVAGTMTLENVEIYCKNGRYCIHNDALGKGEYSGAIQRYINVKCYKYICEFDGNNERLGTTHTLGFGIDREMHHEYINCEFYDEDSGNAFYGHDRNVANADYITEVQSSDIVLRDCVFVAAGTNAVRFVSGYESGDLHIRVKMAGCYMNKQILLDSTGKRNSFDLTVLNSGSPTIVVGDLDNEYPPKVYPPVS